MALQQQSASLCNLQIIPSSGMVQWCLQIIPSSGVVQWRLQMQLAENRGLTMLLLTFGMEKIVNSEFGPEAFRLECAASVPNPWLKICLISY